MLQNLFGQLKARLGRSERTGTGRRDGANAMALGESGRALIEAVELLAREGRRQEAGLLAACWLHCYQAQAWDSDRGVAASAISLDVVERLTALQQERGDMSSPPSTALEPIREAVLHFALTSAISADGFLRVESELHEIRDGTTSPVVARDALSAAAALRGAHFTVTKGVESLELMVDALRHAVAPAAPDRPDPGPSARDLDDLGTALYRLSQLIEDTEPLEESVRFHGLAAQAAHGEQRVAYLDNHGAALYKLAETDRDPEALGRAAEAFREAMAATSPYGARWWSLAQKLLRVLLLVPNICGPGDELDAAVEKGRALVRDSSGAADESWMVITMVADLIGHRFELVGDAQDLEDHIDHLRHALQTCPRSAREWAYLTNDLGGALVSRFEFTQDPADLTKGIAQLTEAEKMMPETERMITRSNLEAARSRLRSTS